MPEHHKEAVCIVNIVGIVGGIEIFSAFSGSERGNILARWGLNSRERDGISVVAVALVTEAKVLRVKNPEDCRELNHQ